MQNETRNRFHRAWCNSGGAVIMLFSCLKFISIQFISVLILQIRKKDSYARNHEPRKLSHEYRPKTKICFSLPCALLPFYYYSHVAPTKSCGWHNLASILEPTPRYTPSLTNPGAVSTLITPLKLYVIDLAAITLPTSI